MVELSQRSGTGTVAVADLDGLVRDDLAALRLGPSGWFRLRTDARGRDEAVAHIRVTEPVEEHLLQLWPAPEADEVRHRLSNRHGRMWRAAVGPPPPEYVATMTETEQQLREVHRRALQPKGPADELPSPEVQARLQQVLVR